MLLINGREGLNSEGGGENLIHLGSSKPVDLTGLYVGLATNFQWFIFELYIAIRSILTSYSDPMDTALDVLGRSTLPVLRESFRRAPWECSLSRTIYFNTIGEK